MHGFTVVQLWLKNFFEHLKKQCQENLVLIILSFVACLVMYFSMFVLGDEGSGSFVTYLKRALLSISPSILFCFFVCRIFRLCFFEKPDYIIKTLTLNMKDVLLDPRRYARMIPMLLISSLVFISFVTMKIFIPEFVPFYADPLFAKIDKFLHFGKLPSDWLAPLLEYPRIIEGLDFFYKLWYYIMFGLWGWAAWGASDNGWRRQFVLSFMLCWFFGGAILATLLSSVGPCFYGLFVEGVNPYADYMKALRYIHTSENLLALRIQDYLVELQFANNNEVRVGISAMPSLHNTLAVLFAIAGYKIHKNLGYILTIYAVLIFIGSVVLGWHYAIDGYAGLFIAFAMWKFAGWCLHHQDRILGLKEFNSSSAA